MIVEAISDAILLENVERSRNKKNEKNAGSKRVSVGISFANSDNFYDKNYDDAYLTITKANTVVSANDIVIDYEDLDGGKS